MQWLELEKGRIENSTWESYESYTCRHIVPYFKPLGLTVEKVTVSHIKGYYDFKSKGGRGDKKAGGLSHVSLKNHSKVLKQVLAAAVLEELTDRNVAQAVPIPRAVQEAEEDKAVYLDAEQANAILFGNEYCDTGYIFTWDNGLPYRPDFLTRAFQQQLAKVGLSKMRYHDLRHSTASILYDKGWGLKDIQEWLGHSDIETTGNIYTHITKSRQKMLAKGLENTFAL